MQPLCHCQPTAFPHECPCLRITLHSAEMLAIARAEPLIVNGQPRDYEREFYIAAWTRLAAREKQQSSPERDAELRYANAHRCDHRSIEPTAEEPCACPVIGLQPIYACSLHGCDCADLRQPQAPARFCRRCPDHTEL